MAIAVLVVTLLDLVVVSGILLLFVRDRRDRRQDDLTAVLAGKRQFITIEILNSAELAASRSRFGGVAGTVAPAYVRNVVYEKVAKQLADEFGNNGVEADVAIHVN